MKVFPDLHSNLNYLVSCQNIIQPFSMCDLKAIKERTVWTIRCSIWYLGIVLYLEYLSKTESIMLIDVNYILDGSASVNEDLR